MMQQPPILKIGAVIRSRKSEVGNQKSDFRLQSSDFRFLILRPIPKHPGEVPHFVLPRGTRQYCDEAGAWHDARDAATGEKYRDRLEDFVRGLAREIEEEAGVTPAMLAAAEVRELGPRMFQSRSKGVYPIHWFVVTLDENAAQQLLQQTPVDALELRWATLPEIKEMAARGEFSAGYVPVIAEAVAKGTF